MDFYVTAALLLDRLDAKKGSLKGLASAAGDPGKAKRLIAVTAQTLKYRPVVQKLLKKTSLISQEKRLFAQYSIVSSTTLSPTDDSGRKVNRKESSKGSRGRKKDDSKPTAEALATIMVHDLLFSVKGRGLSLPKEHKVRKCLDGWVPRLKAEKEREKIRLGLTSDSELALNISPLENPSAGNRKSALSSDDVEERSGILGVRWMRINELKWTVKEALEWCQGVKGWNKVDGWEEVARLAQTTLKGKSKESDSTTDIHFAQDVHIPTLLAMPSSISLPSLEPYKEGRLIAQDKASCLPAQVLLALEEHVGDVIDATAAPGNKTTLLDSLMHVKGFKGTLFAFERDKARFATLESMCAKAGCESVQAIHGDFLATNPKDPQFANVTHILVDPSCSGSGILNRLDRLTDLPNTSSHADASSYYPSKDPDRLRALSNFQLTIVSHAMRFKNVRKVVYSTCSIWEEEDEEVVKKLLSKKEFISSGWTVGKKEDVLPTWHRRGLVEKCTGLEGRVAPEILADGMIRCDPLQDGTIGFFLSCLVQQASCTVPPGPQSSTSLSKKRLRDDTTPADHVPTEIAKKADLLSPPPTDLDLDEDEPPPQKAKIAAGPASDLLPDRPSEGGGTRLTCKRLGLRKCRWTVVTSEMMKKMGLE